MPGGKSRSRPNPYGQRTKHITGNNNTQYATRTLATHDLVTGEELAIAYFPRAGVVTINGYSVSRSQEFDDLSGKAVLFRPLDEDFFRSE